MDNSTKRKEMLTKAEGYLRSKYPYWDKSFLVYEKGIKTKDRVLSIRQNYDKQRTLDTSQSENVIKTKLPEGFWYLEEGKND